MGNEISPFFNAKLTHRQKMTLRSICSVEAIRTGFIFILPFLLLGFASGCSGEKEAATDSEEFFAVVEPVEIQLVSSSNQTRRFTGVIKGRRESRLGFNQPGNIQQVLFAEGDAVKKGQILAQLNTDSLEAKKKQTLADKKAADALLAELVAGPRNQEILSAKATVTQLESDFQLAEIKKQRHQRLRNTNAISAQEYDNAYYLALAAKGRLEAAKQNLSLLNEGTRKEKITAQKARIAQLEAGIESIDVMIRESQIEAPYDGIIASRLSDEGEIVAPGTPIFSIIETNHLQAWVGIPEKSLPSMVIGQDYQLVSSNSSIQAKLRAILPNLNTTTRTRTVILDIPNDQKNDLASGAVVRLEVSQETKQDGFWIPKTALTRGEKGLWSAMGLVPAEDNPNKYRTKRLDVEVLHIESERVLVRGTLLPGQKIVRSGLHKLTVGQLVEVKEGSK